MPTVMYISLHIFRGCHRQPLCCSQLDIFCMASCYGYIMQIYIIHETTVVRPCLHLYWMYWVKFGYREFIFLAILFGRKWTVCETKGLSKPASKRCLSELWMFSSAADHGTDSYSTSGRWAKRQLRDSTQQVIDFTLRLLREWSRPPRRTSLRHLKHMTGVT